MTGALLVALWCLAGLVGAFWVLVSLDVRRWWPASVRLEPPADEPSGDGDRRNVVVVIPARDEAEVLRQTLPTLLAQSADFAQLVFVDDRSTDGTGDLARELIDDVGADDASASVIEGASPPAGWSGKLWALRQGLDAALSDPASASARWFLFTDADIRHPTWSIRALRKLAEERDRDLVSVMARLRAATFWERLLIPVFVWFFQLMYPFRLVRRDTSKVAAAAGGCILVSRGAFERAGGFEAIHDAVIDDISLARRVRDVGGRLWLGLSSAIRSARGYDSLGGIVRMVSRTAFDELRYSFVRLAVTLVALALLFVAPPVLCLLAACLDAPLVGFCGAVAWALQTALLYPAVRHHRVPARYALSLPIASLFYMWMTWLSAWNWYRGRGPQWKGREIGKETPE